MRSTGAQPQASPPSPANRIGFFTDTTTVDDAATDSYYKVTAWDSNGNEGGASNEWNAGTPVASSELCGAFPNPSYGRSEIRYQLSTMSQVKLRIYNIVGQAVKTYDLGIMPAGKHTVVWEDDAPAGIYFCRMTAGGSVATKRISIVR